MPGSERRVAVILASAGRPKLLAEVLDDVSAQSWQDFELVVSVPDQASIPLTGLPPRARLVNDRGLAAQRNAGLDAVPNASYVFCFDDDAVIATDYIANAMRFFELHPDVVALTGRVLADGATGDEIARGFAKNLLNSDAEPPTGQWKATRELYGCNFAFRPQALRGQRFDSRLPLYSWLEDHDFARRAMRHGQLAAVHDCVIVHRGAKSGGRTSHVRLGYSQFMNPAYLRSVGSFPLWLALLEIVPRFGKNAIYAIAGNQKGWRRERLKGNALGLADVLRGRFTPERIVDLPA